MFCRSSLRKRPTGSVSPLSCPRLWATPKDFLGETSSKSCPLPASVNADTQPDVCKMEGLLPKLYGDDAVEIPGARSLLDALIARNSPWAIVTSGTTPLVTGWLKVLSLAIPEHLVTAESVKNGKPDPTCYLMGREKLGLDDPRNQILVLEDSPAGIRAGKAAGCKVLGLVTSHTAEQVVAAGPDWVVRDLDSVRVVGGGDGKVTIEISNGLKVSAP